jgi:hypothetical protein
MTTSKTIAALLGPTLVASAAMVLANLDAMPGLIKGIDLPLNFHPAAIRASAGFTPSGAV